MALYGGMSKSERNRIKIRVRSAMKARTELEGRYLGGRPRAAHGQDRSADRPSGGAAKCGATGRDEFSGRGQLMSGSDSQVGSVQKCTAPGSISGMNLLSVNTVRFQGLPPLVGLPTLH